MNRTILFICSANKDRSKTAEDHFSKKYPNIRFESAGTNGKLCRQLGTNPVSKEIIERADEIFVMETKHMQFIKSTFGSDHNKKITVLNIPDKYTYGQKELVDLLENLLKEKIR